MASFWRFSGVIRVHFTCFQRAMILPSVAVEHRGGWVESWTARDGKRSFPFGYAEERFAQDDRYMWNRREFTVTLNGGFAILRPTGWFAAVRLPGSNRSITGDTGIANSKRSAAPSTHLNPNAAVPHEWASLTERKAADPADSQDTAMGRSIARVGPLMRPAVIVLVATAIMSLVLWWLCSLGPSLVWS